MTSGRIKITIAAVAMAAPVAAWSAPAAAVTTVSCGSTVHGSVTLTHDLHCHGDGVTVRSGTLNLNHHVISGDGAGSGVIVAGPKAVIRNGSVKDFFLGVTANVDGAAVSLSYLTVASVNGMAVDGTSINTATLNHVTIRDSADAIFVTAPNTVSVTDSQLSGNQRAITLVNDGHASADGTTIESNGYGIFCTEGLVSVSRSLIARNGTGADLFDCEGSRFTSSGFVGNHGSAIAEDEAFADFANPTLTVSRDVFYKNGTGLSLSAQGRADVIRDSAFVNNGSGIVAQPCDACDVVPNDQLVSNYFASNTSDGANWGFGNVTVSRNRFFNNGVWGFIAGPGATVTDGGGNIAHGNHAGNCRGLTCAS